MKYPVDSGMMSTVTSISLYSPSESVSTPSLAKSLKYAPTGSKSPA